MEVNRASFPAPYFPIDLTLFKIIIDGLWWSVQSHHPSQTRLYPLYVTPLTCMWPLLPVCDPSNPYVTPSNPYVTPSNPYVTSGDRLGNSRSSPDSNSATSPAPSSSKKKAEVNKSKSGDFIFTRPVIFSEGAGAEVYWANTHNEPIKQWAS